MTNRVLRWLSTISLVLLALVVAWTFSPMAWTWIVPPTTSVTYLYILGLVLLPTTVVAVCEITGVATLVVSLQRKHWGWFVGMLLCLIVHFYSGSALTLLGINILNIFGSGSSVLRVMLYGYLALTPLVVVVLIYIWTRRQLSARPADKTDEAGGAQ